MRNADGGRRLKALMAYHMAMHEPVEFTVSSLAKAAGVERATIHDWWRGKTEPRESSLRAVAEALTVPVDSLVAAYNSPGGPTDEELASGAASGVLERLGASVDEIADRLAAIEAGQDRLAALLQVDRSAEGVER